MKNVIKTLKEKGYKTKFDDIGHSYKDVIITKYCEVVLDDLLKCEDIEKLVNEADEFVKSKTKLIVKSEKTYFINNRLQSAIENNTKFFVFVSELNSLKRNK